MFGFSILSFNTQPPEGGWLSSRSSLPFHTRFNTQPPEGGCCQAWFAPYRCACFNTQPPEGGCGCIPAARTKHDVSTHSRPKAAGPLVAQIGSDWLFQHTAARRRLFCDFFQRCALRCFNTQPPEGGCNLIYKFILSTRVSTHSRPKAAGRHGSAVRVCGYVSTHSRPKAAGTRIVVCNLCRTVSTHSRPKAAAAILYFLELRTGFQHTAARRRLGKAVKGYC